MTIQELNKYRAQKRRFINSRRSLDLLSAKIGFRISETIFPVLSSLKTKTDFLILELRIVNV